MQTLLLISSSLKIFKNPKLWYALDESVHPTAHVTVFHRSVAAFVCKVMIYWHLKFEPFNKCD